MPLLEEISLPNILIEDIDQAVVDLFEKVNPISIAGRKVPVIYATNERWAQMQKQKGLRDDNLALILPLISIRRTGIDLIPGKNSSKMGNVSSLVLGKRIATIRNSRTDRIPFRVKVQYSSILSNPKRPYGKKQQPVYETVTIPAPDWYNFNYEIIFWTSYITDSNVIEENVLIKYRDFLTIAEHYKMLGYISSSISDDSNVEDFTDKERIVRQRYSFVVEGYLLDNQKAVIDRSFKEFKFSTETVMNFL